MRLLIIGNDTKLFEEGSAVRKRSLEYAAGYERYAVVVASTHKRCEDEPGIGQKKNIFFFSLYSRYKLLVFAKAVITACRQAKKSDVVSGQDPYLFGLIALIAARIAGKKLHIQIHTLLCSTPLSRLVLKRADRIRVVSQTIKAAASSIATCGIDVLPVYIDISAYRNTSPDTAIRQAVSGTRFLVLAMSRLEPEKRIEAIISSIGPLTETYPWLSLVIVGEGTKKAELERQVRKNGYRRVAFLPWTNTPERYYKAADLFISLSAFEGFGMTIVESMLAGTPVVTTDVGVADEYIKNGYNSWVVPEKEDVQALVEHILSHQSLLARVRDNLAATSFEQLKDFEEYKSTLYRSFISARNS